MEASEGILKGCPKGKVNRVNKDSSHARVNICMGVEGKDRRK